MNASEAASTIEHEMQDWLGMSERLTRAAVARAITAMPDKATDLEALRRVARTAYREVMFQQAIELTRLEVELSRTSSHHFVDRVSDVLTSMLTGVR